MHFRSPQADLSGQVAVVTGANRGMGRETACEIARMGAAVVLACRNTDLGQQAAKQITARTGARTVSAMAVDLASPVSVCRFAAEFESEFGQLDILVNNAAASLQQRQVTDEGFERTWATNVLGPHLLSTRLEKSLRCSGGARILEVSTRAAGGLDLSDTQYERRPFSGVGAYRASKQAARMLAWHRAARYAPDRVSVVAINPGYVYSDLSRNVAGALKVLTTLTSFMANDPLDGADTAIWAASCPELDGTTAKFFSNRHEIRCRFRDPASIEDVRLLVEGQVRQWDRGIAR